MISKLLTWLFGWKYYVVTYEVKINKCITKGNMNLRTKRLVQPNSDYIRKILGKRYDLNKDNILILNIMRVNRIISEWPIVPNSSLNNEGDNDEL